MLSRRDLLRHLRTSGLVTLTAFGVPATALAAPGTPGTPPGVATSTPATAASPTPVTIASATPRPVVLPTSTPRPTPSPTPQAWVQALRTLPLWSGPDDNAEQFGYAARWDYFLIVKPQVAPRLYVQVARTRNYAWVDALSVGPSGPPPPGWPPADLAPPPDDMSVGWVATAADVPLWADADASLFVGLAPAYTPLKQLEPQIGSLLHVQDPFSATDSWIDASDVGPISSPDPVGAPGRWWGISYVDAANLRAQPTTRSDTLGELPSGRPIVVNTWVAGEEVIPDNPTWAYLGNATYLYSSVLRPVALPAAPSPPDVGYAGRWIDLNLLHQVVVAYEGASAVRLARTSTGRPGWETAPGVYAVQRRVANETMDSTSLIGLDAARADYKVENVRWTQYFSADGKALHENYWKPRDEFGIPSSHGCAGLVAEDARFFWDWADVGVPVVAHY
jgi:lipoprotein-anchoring transpeptidase ErfK/SrfK